MSINGYISVEQSFNISGQAELVGAKNAALPIMASLILVSGKSVLHSVPNSADINEMIDLLTDLGAKIHFDKDSNILEFDGSSIYKAEVKHEVMDKMRASILVMGPLLSRFKKARVAFPGGCSIGARPIDFHLKGFECLGVSITYDNDFIYASADQELNKKKKIVLEYPSVGATENLIMFATLQNGSTTIVNAALEPEVLDFIEVLKKMGADIKFDLPATVIVTGVKKLNPIMHTIIPDRLEAGALLLASAITGGKIILPSARPDQMEMFLEKLKQMGHEVITGIGNNSNLGIKLIATKNPKATNIKTCPYPGFPTDLQSPMMAALCLANGVSIVDETVFENRLMHVKELEKMGAQISVKNSKANVNGVNHLYGANVIASDIRASAALVLAGLAATGKTQVFGLHHWRRGYDKLEDKLKILGAKIEIIQE
ncbi:UDP-N-acetylglucosamine 1-carboxyvinyltransferase [Candidatus Dependentiae bacterium]|nr:UDP-N-acetylglucosamine 1-carboxyvinyltransferase [Candidatus Dependentiae bacterium]MBU4387319.1 UDP-N-acetylglucosamine 1-carboxyvinyltransferase [Candidatus Dependentiae bacterium]MCG2756216.1 UDP-N-acetylglucosamine 1-carboxyvinyltransferase [Candidatus Dependentiae bacterium]